MSDTSDSELDRRIRELVADAVADAPQPPDASTFTAVAGQTNGRRGTQWGLLTAAGAAAAAAAIVAFVVVPGLGDEAIRDVDPADRPPVTADLSRGPEPTSPPTTAVEPEDFVPATPPDTTDPDTAPSTEPGPDLSIEADLRVRPFGAQGDNQWLRVMAFNVESAADANSAGDVVLIYELDLGFDPAGRSGTVIAPEVTSDGQLAVEVGCVVEGCLEFVPVNDFRQTSIQVTVRRTTATLEPGTHLATFELVYDDDTTEAFDLVLWAEPEPSADISDAVLASTGPPQRVQTVFTEGNFAYHATAAFGSIWVLNKNSGTVSRIDEITGEVLASIPIRQQPAGGGTGNRLTATDDAVYTTAAPAVRIDPDTNEATAIGDGVNTAAIIADNDTVWAASFFGPIVRIDPDMTVTEIGPAGRWVDLAISNGLVWAVEQVREGGRLIAFDSTTGEIRHDSVIADDVNEFAVRLVADDTDVVVGVDTSGGGGRTGRLIIVDPDTGAITDTVTLDSRPEGIVLTPQRIWTSGAVLDRTSLEIENTDGFGFTITRGSDGSIWGTGGVPSSHTGESVVYRYAPGDLAG